MSVSPTAPAGSPATCAACGATLNGRFCSRCGAPAEAAVCAACQATLSPGAKFCHRCGAPVRPPAAGSREKTAWMVTGAAALIALLVIVWRVGAFRPTVPDMGNAGNVGGDNAGPSGRAPDISAMSPRQRFDRLYDRVMRSSDAGDTVTVAQFAPMALGAYALLDTVNTDARYHAAMIHLALGDVGSARALADSIETDAPGHLFGYIVRGEAAERQNDAAALTRSYRDFLEHYDGELRSGRIEYSEHQPILDDFRTRAKASLGR